MALTPTQEREEADLVEAMKGDETPAKAEPTGSLYWRIAKIMGELSAIPPTKMRHVEVATKSGGTYSYDYITEATLMEELRPRLARERIAVFYSDKILRSPSLEHSDDNLTIVEVELTFVDGLSSEKWRSSAQGYGTDHGDKGANKAKTSALRYLLWKTFLFASDVDPETENVDRRGKRGNGAAKIGKPASEKQQDLVSRLLTDADEKGITFGGKRPQDAVHVRTAVPDMTGPQASGMIDLLRDSLRTEGGDLDASPLDERLGEIRQGGDLDATVETTWPGEEALSEEELLRRDHGEGAVSDYP